jgi:hypothetical protein
MASFAGSHILFPDPECCCPGQVTDSVRKGDTQCLRRGLGAGVVSSDLTLQRQDDRILCIRPEPVIRYEDRRLIKQLRDGAVGEIKMNLNPARVRFIAHPSDGSGPYQGHQLIMDPNNQSSRDGRLPERPHMPLIGLIARSLAGPCKAGLCDRRAGCPDRGRAQV